MSEDKKELRIYGMKPVYFVGTFVIMMAGSAMGILPQGVLFVLFTSILLGEALSFVGDRIPIFNTYFGGGVVLALFGASALNYFGVLPASLVETLGSHVVNGGGYFDFFIVPLICGSILGMNRKILINAGLKYVVPIITGVAISFVCTGTVGMLLGYGFKEAVLFIAMPIMGGGVGAGAMPMATMYANANLGEYETIFSALTVAVTLGNAIAVVMSSILRGVGEKCPSLTGNGVLAKGFDEVEANKQSDGKISLSNLGPGIVISATLYTVSIMLSQIIPIHEYAILVFLAIIIKVANLCNEEVEQQVNTFYTTMSKVFILSLIAAAGIGIFDFEAILASFTNPVFVTLTITTIVTAALGAGLGGLLVKFYFVESAITAGMCMANMGGTGDIAVLAASKRLDLMPFAAISSRIGGALMLIIGGLLSSMW